jgi:hypothetical protein
LNQHRHTSSHSIIPAFYFPAANFHKTFTQPRTEGNNNTGAEQKSWESGV